MKITDKQAGVLENLHRVEVRRGGSRTRYALDGQDCRNQIVGLAARGIISWDGRGKPSKLAEPDGIVGPRRDKPKRDGSG